MFTLSHKLRCELVAFLRKKGMLNVILNSYQISKLSLHSVIKCIDYFGLFLKGGYYLDELYGTYMLENVKIKAN